MNNEVSIVNVYKNLDSWVFFEIFNYFYIEAKRFMSILVNNEDIFNGLEPTFIAVVILHSHNIFNRLAGKYYKR